MITLVSPILAELDNSYFDKLEQLKEALTFTDQGAVYELQRFKKAIWFVNKYGEEAWTEKVNELKSKQKVCLLDQLGGRLYVPSGLVDYVAKTFDDKIENKVNYPEPQGLEWFHKPEYSIRYYQKNSFDNLVKAKHAGVSLSTGSGKSLVILELVKYFGLKTVIMAPSISIAEQIYDLLVYHLGKKWVGLFGNGKKETKKLIVVAISKSLANLTSDSPITDDLEDTQVFIADESHLTPAETLKNVCFGVLADAPYRFFFSATQMRNDGSDLLLEAIIGPIVYNYDSKQAIKEGFLAKPKFLISTVNSPSSYASQDALKMLDKHLYNNPLIHAKAAHTANDQYEKLGGPILIMIDHVDQFKYLYPHLRLKFGFAHGGVTKNNKDAIPAEYHKSDVKALVKQFNDGELPVLIGTSCISVGTDLRPTRMIINLQGGKSEIKFKQLIGRGTRKVPGKDEFLFVDFRVKGIYMLEKQLAGRIEAYKDVWDDVIFL